MIITAILYLFKFLFATVLNWLPVGSALPTTISDALNFFIPLWSKWENLLPLSDLLIVITLIISIEGYIWIFGLGNFVYKKIRG